METSASKRKTKSDLQSTFLTSIKRQLPGHLSLSDELAELLHISRDSAYRRIRKETILSLDEVKTLCQRFNVSFDSLMAQECGHLSFAINAEYGPGHSLKSWLESIHEQLNSMKSIPDATMIWNSKDLPILHYFQFPKLTAFKFYWWMNLVHGEVAIGKYDERLIGADLLSIAERIWKQYSHISSTIVVSREMINTTLRQLEYAYDSGFLTQEQSLELCDSLEVLVRNLEDQARQGIKHDDPQLTIGKLDVYLNELMIGDNTILFKTGDHRTSFVTYHNFNVMSTTNDSFCSQTEHYMSVMIQKGVLISRVSERERARFFNRIQRQIEDTRVVIKGL